MKVLNRTEVSFEGSTGEGSRSNPTYIAVGRIQLL